MTSIQEFKCIFCQDKFESKEELQIHFRKHGDPNFGQNKGKTKQQNEGTSTDKKEETEMVNCDVCSEVFPTISKAITHKHKVHPEHDAKYFCPWCGKLFTMKHLYNKHVESTHKDYDKESNFSFPCNTCDVNFLLASAMLYHNKFFHRQDTELPQIGNSKKVQTFGQEMLLIYYCPFCGDEYNNKINLHKHMLDEHYDENQHPEDVLRCPLCEAVFYHLDAYELHLTFHSVEDMYNETNEIVSQITDFSLEAVPPLMEKVENDIPDEIDPIGLAKMLQVGLEDTADSGTERKKRKKHKKSKKSAITLDEFLNMNQDVFGEGLDVQGIVEVPTQIVTNTLKRKQPVLNPGAKISSTDLQKLKSQGIMVKMKSTPLQQKAIKIKPQQASNKQVKILNSTGTSHKPNMNECNEVIAKLMNQSNAQIKIVKKTLGELNLSTQDNKEAFTEKLPPETGNEEESSEQEKAHSTSTEVAEEKKNFHIPQTKITEMDIDKTESSKTSKDLHKCDEVPKLIEKNKLDTSLDVLRKISQHLTVKSLNPTTNNLNEVCSLNNNETKINDNIETSHNSNNIENNDLKSKIIGGDIELDNLKVVSTQIETDRTDKQNTVEEMGDISEEEDQPLSKLKNDNMSVLPVTTTIGIVENDKIQNSFLKSNDTDIKNKEINHIEKPQTALQHLSKFLTVKSVSPKSKPGGSVENDTELNKDLNEYNMSDEDSNVNVNNDIENSKKNMPSMNSQIKPKQCEISYSTRDQLLGEEDLSDVECDERNEQSVNKARVLKSLDPLKSISGQISIKPSAPQASSKNIPDNKDENKDDNVTVKAPNIKETPSHLEALKKLGSNITLKSNKQPVENITQDDNLKDESLKQPNKTESPSHLEALKKLGSNITLKPNKKTSDTTNKEDIDAESANRYDDDFDNEKMKPPKITESPAHLEALKKLGSNITLKSNKQLNEVINNANVKAQTPTHVGAIIKGSHNETLKSNKHQNSIQKPVIKHNSNSQIKKPSNNTVINKELHCNSIITKSNYSSVTKSNFNTAIMNQSTSTKSVTSNFSHATKTNISSSNISKKCSTQATRNQTEVLNIEDSDDEYNEGARQSKQKVALKNRPGPACSKIGYIKNNIEREIKNEMDKARTEMENSLKKLGHNITIKSNNVLDFPQSPEIHTAPEDNWANEDCGSNSPKPNQLKITEIANDDENVQASGDEDFEIETQNAIVESPDHSEDELETHRDKYDIEDQITAATVKKPDNTTYSQLDQFKNLNKNITIKSLNKNQKPETSGSRDNSPQNRQNNLKQIVCRPGNNQVAQKTVSVNKANSVNKEVTTSVKTYQTETVIEEITTTVTKTIRTVNKTMNQKVHNTTESLSTNMVQNKPVQGTKPTVQMRNPVRPAIRHITPNTRPRINSVVGTSAKKSNQLVPVRPNLNIPRPSGPRMQVAKSPVSQQKGPKPLRVAPNVNLSPTVKRQAPEEVSGPFSQFKKVKESLIPGDDLEQGNESIQRISSASRVTESNFSSINTIKGNSTITHMKKNEAVSTSSQQLNKLGSMSGLKIMKSSQCQKSSYSEVKEISPTKRSTLDAIEKLQKQGLLIKKPRIEDSNVDSENSEFEET